MKFTLAASIPTSLVSPYLPRNAVIVRFRREMPGRGVDKRDKWSNAAAGNSRSVFLTYQTSSSILARAAVCRKPLPHLRGALSYLSVIVLRTTG